MNEWDLIVVGSGPAGSTAARFAAEKGLRTLLIEKDKHPRNKACGGGLSLGAVKEMGVPLPESLIERRCSGVDISQGSHSGQVHSKEPMAFMILRTTFDQYLTGLACAAGAVLHEEEPCLSAERDEKEIRVITDKGIYSAPMVIGADGFFSKVAPLVRRPWVQKEKRFCATAEVPLQQREIDRLFGDSVHLNYGWVKLGYAWVFPKRKQLSFGIGGSLQNGKETIARLRDFISSFGIETNAPIEGCWLPVTSFRTPSYAERVLLSGDAAGYADCFSGEGIRYALSSGRMAAETAIKAHTVGDFSANFLSHYSTQFDSLNKADLLSSLRLSALAFRFPSLVLGTMLRSEEVLLRYGEVLRGEFSFRDFSLWSMKKIPGLWMKRFF